MSIQTLPKPALGCNGFPWTEETDPSIYAGRAWPKITLITPSYNQALYLEETIRSVLLQNYPNLEYFVIDGGSTDNSVAIIRNYAKSIDFWVSEKDGGQAQAINKGFRKASGEWVGWINSDDYLMPNSLCALVQTAESTKAQWVAGSVKFVHVDNPQQDGVHAQSSSPDLIDWLLFKFHFHQPGTLWKRRLFAEHGYLQEQMHYSFDWAFWCKLIAAGVHPVVIPDTVAGFRMHSESKTCTRWDRFAAESESLIASYLPALGAREKLLAQRRRTSLICTQLQHESDRLVAAGQSSLIFGKVLSAARHRPHVLGRKTPYRVLFQSLARKSSRAAAPQPAQ